MLLNYIQKGEFTLICEKCGGIVNANMKCSICGYNNSDVDYTSVASPKSSSLRSMRITILMSIIIVLDAIVVIGSLNIMLTKGTSFGSIILLAIPVMEIIVCLFILKMKRWALYTYLGLCVVAAIVQLLSFNFIAIIFKALLLYFVFRKDWEYFN